MSDEEKGTTYTKWDKVPPNLKTKTALRREFGLKPSKGQRPVAKMQSWRKKRREWHEVFYDLYDMDEAIPVRTMTPAQAAALKKAQEASQARWRCNDCNGRLYGRDELLHQVCADCSEIRYVSSQGDAAEAWAGRMLATAGAIILDTETNGLYGEVIELAIVDLTGRTLINERYRPTRPFDQEAVEIHGITAEAVADLPHFIGRWPEIRAIITAAPAVIAYNARYDETVIEQTVEYQSNDTEVIRLQFQDAMEPYSFWRGSSRWLPLGGDHTAVGDCLQVLAHLKQMAAGAALNH